MTQPFDTKPVEHPDPSCYLRKREGSPGGLRLEPARKQRHGATGGSPCTAADSPKAATGSPKAADGTHFRRLYNRSGLPIHVDQCRPGRNTIKRVEAAEGCPRVVVDWQLHVLAHRLP